MRYKVWVQIEALNEDDDPVEDAPVPLPDCIGEFRELENAEKRQWFITDWFCNDKQNSDVNPNRRRT